MTDPYILLPLLLAILAGLAALTIAGSNPPDSPA